MNKLFKLPLTIAAVAVLCCTALFFAFADDTSDSYDLSQVTEDMLSDMGGVATLVIQSENATNAILPSRSPRRTLRYS